jgi:hypothetical protein
MPCNAPHPVQAGRGTLNIGATRGQKHEIQGIKDFCQYFFGLIGPVETPTSASIFKKLTN